MKSKNRLQAEVTENYLAGLDKSSPPSAADIEEELLTKINEALELSNATMPKGRKARYLQDLTPAIIAAIMTWRYDIRLLSTSGMDSISDKDLLIIYQDSGPDAGTYTYNEGTLRKLARQYNGSMTTSDFREIMSTLRDTAKRQSLCTDPDLIAVNNGIFNYRTKTLQPFDPDLVFLAKSRVNYQPNPVNPVIHNPDDNTDWDVETWMQEPSDDPEIVNLLWEILGAIIRPNVRWNKSAWFYSTIGNNGKGTLCELMRNLCGPGTYASIPLANFGKEFMLECLVRASAIIVDENDVGNYIDNAANLKAIITNDVIQMNRKFKTPISFQFRGFMVQCLNELPRVRDKSDSFYRRQLFVPFTKCFTGMERKYIKSDYLKRTDVLEYVLHKVLHMTYYSLSEPAACKAGMDEYKMTNDPVRQFCEEILPQCQWDLLPFTFLYDLYKAWSGENNPSGRLQGKQGFIADVMNVLPDFPEWSCKDKKQQVRRKKLMDAAEPLIMTYDLNGWKNPHYNGGDPAKICSPVLSDTYRGLQRSTSIQATP